MSNLSDRSNRPPASTVNPYPRKFLAPVSAEVAFLLGHRDAPVTRLVYIHEIADARGRQDGALFLRAFQIAGLASLVRLSRVSHEV